MLKNLQILVHVRSVVFYVCAQFLVLVGLCAGQENELKPEVSLVYQGSVAEVFKTVNGRQAVAVDSSAFYALNNFAITKHDKKTGEALITWDGISDETGPLIHLDSGIVHQGKLYAAHSNYPNWPMHSSIEIWDTNSLTHIESHSFGVYLGSMTWLDRYDGFWWAGFGNYDKVQDGQSQAYGGTQNTWIVKMDDSFNTIDQWRLPNELHPRLSPMTNSGGSWSEEGLLYLTGHDYPEIYIVDVPANGETVDWLATVEVAGLNGQGIAWDRDKTSKQTTLWGILKSKRLVYRIEMPVITKAMILETP